MRKIGTIFTAVCATTREMFISEVLSSCCNKSGGCLKMFIENGAKLGRDDRDDGISSFILFCKKWKGHYGQTIKSQRKWKTFPALRSK